ncbi:flippase [Gracilibacillus salitolerans]|nr:flippase [Gracilibacillus salitolerans]
MNKLKNSQLAKVLSGSFIIKITGTFLTFLVSIILARTLGVENYGHYAYAISIISILSVPTTLGLPNVIVRFSASYKTKSEWNFLKGLINLTNKSVLLIAIFIMFFSFLISWYFVGDNDSIAYNTFLISLLLLPLMALNSLRAAALRGINRVIIGQLPEHIILPFVFISFSLIATIFFEEINSIEAMFLRVLSVLIAFLIGAALLYNNLLINIKSKKPKYEIKKWVHSALPLLFVGGMMLINNKLDIIMLGAIRSSIEVGIYQVVINAATLIVFALSAVNSVMAPQFSKLFIKEEKCKLQRIVTLSNRVAFAFALPVSLIFIIFGSWILHFIYGADFARGGIALAILSLGQLVSAAFGSVGNLLNMTGNEKFSAFGVVISAICNIILNSLLIPVWGINGAAIATSVSLMLWNALLAFWVYKKVKIYPSIVGNGFKLFKRRL